MTDRIQVLGQYIIEKTKKNFNFKVIKMDSYFKNVLYCIGTEYYLVSDTEYEIIDTAHRMSTTRFCDYPEKFAKKYTHMRFVKANQKKIEAFNVKGKRYFIVQL